MKGLYIHIPFCVKKCEYCDFLSFPSSEDKYEKYIDAVIKDMSQYKGETVDTIFIGGGTPSVLTPYLIEKLCNSIAKTFILARDGEWTMEANPGTLDNDKIKSIKKSGINRVSVGVQSFDDKELKAIGRIHTAEEAYNTVLNLSKSGFKNISIDLMMSLPMQTKDSFKRTLKRAVSLPVTHISVYSLIVEDGTPIKEKYDKGIYELPDEDMDRELYEYTRKFLSEHGFERYEISNYAKPQMESKHNIKYWDCDEYIGIGLGAHSYLDGKRFSKTCVWDDYISGDYTYYNVESLSQKDMMGEFMMLGLRKIQGVSADEFKSRFKSDIESVYGDIFNKYIRMGLMEKVDNCYRLTIRGLDVSNSVMCEFL